VSGVCQCGVAGDGGAQGQRLRAIRRLVGGLEKGKGSLDSRRGGRSGQGVRGSRHFPASQGSRAGLSRKVRNAGQRGAHDSNLPYVFVPLLSSGCSILPSPSDLGEAGGRAGAECGAVRVCACHVAIASPSDHPSVLLLTTKALSKRILQQNSLARHWARDWRALAQTQEFHTAWWETRISAAARCASRKRYWKGR